MIAFRDALRASADLRRAYAALKLQLAASHSGNRNAYTNAKGDFLASALREVDISPPSISRLPE